MNKSQKISFRLKESWKDPSSGFNSEARRIKLSESTKNNMKHGSALRENQIKKVKDKWRDPNSKYNSKEYLDKMKKFGALKHIQAIKNETILCDYGCGNIAKYKYIKLNKYCCSENWQSCPSKRKESKKLIEQELAKPNSWFHSKECSDYRRKRLLDGAALVMLKSNKIVSKPQLQLFKIVCDICPYVMLEYPCLNYSIDIVIPKLNIAIEYDGSYYHKDLEYDINRQKQLEDEGWKFIRYRDYIPTKNILFNDIMGII